MATVRLDATTEATLKRLSARRGPIHSRIRRIAWIRNHQANRPHGIPVIWCSSGAALDDKGNLLIVWADGAQNLNRGLGQVEEGSLLKVKASGGTGFNLFAVAREGGCFQGLCGYDHFLGCQDMSHPVF